MRKVITLVPCTHPHFCYGADNKFITPLMLEFIDCCCKCDGNGATNIKDFAASRLNDEELLQLQQWLEQQ